MSTKSIAILGCTGHVGKNLIYYFGREERFELVLFSRDKKKIKKIVSENHFKNNFTLNNYEEFNESKFDVIINCIGISDPAKIESEEKIIMKLTEDFDQLILDYLKNNSDVSRFMDLNTRFLISEIISSINQKKKFITNEFDFYRDYIHPEDLCLFVKK